MRFGSNYSMKNVQLYLGGRQKYVLRYRYSLLVYTHTSHILCFLITFTRASLPLHPTQGKIEYSPNKEADGSVQTTVGNL